MSTILHFPSQPARSGLLSKARNASTNVQNPIQAYAFGNFASVNATCSITGDEAVLELSAEQLWETIVELRAVYAQITGGKQV